MKKRSTAITGACGEHYIAAYLSAHELIVAIPRAGVPGSDLFVSKQTGGRPLRVQVKTGTQSFKKDKQEGQIYLWSTSFSVIDQHDESLWYAFVWLKGWPKGESHPEVFFVPSLVVVACMKKCQEEKHTWPYYWMRVDDAKQYQGSQGVQALISALESPGVLGAK